MHRLRPPPFGAPGRRGHRAAVPSHAVRGGWSWGHSRARRRCIRRLRARAWRARWRRSGVGPSRRASRRTSASPVRSRGCRAWLDHHGTGSLVDPVVIQAHTAGREVIESPVLTFFHLDCLCSDVRLNVDFDLTLTVLADLLYRSLSEQLKGFAQAGPSKLFRKFVDTPGMIEITAKGVIVRLSKRAHNPLLKEAGLTQPTRAVPWLGGRCVHLVCP